METRQKRDGAVNVRETVKFSAEQKRVILLYHFRSVVAATIPEMEGDSFEDVEKEELRKQIEELKETLEDMNRKKLSEENRIRQELSEIFFNRMNDLHAQRRVSSNRHRDNELLVVEVKAELELEREKAEALNEELEELKKEKMGMLVEMQTLRDEELEKTLKSGVTDYMKLIDLNHDLNEANEKLEAENFTLHEEVADLRAELEALRDTQGNEDEEETDSVKSEDQTSTKKKDDLLTELQLTKKQLSDSQAECQVIASNYAAHLQEANKNQEEMQEKIDLLEQDYAEALQKLELVQRDHEGESMKEIEEKLQTMEKEKLELKAEVRDLQQKLKNSNDSITELQAQQIQVTLALELSKKAKEELEEKVNDIQQQYQEIMKNMEEELKKCSKQKLDLEVKAKDLEETMMAKVQHYTELQAEHAEVLSKLDSAIRTADELQKRTDADEGQHKEMLKNLKETVKEYAKMNQELDFKVKMLVEEITRKDQQNADLQKEHVKLEHEMEKVKEEMGIQKKEVQGLRAARKGDRELQEVLQKKIEEREEEIGSMERDSKKSCAALQDLYKTLDSLNMDNQKLQSENTSLRLRQEQLMSDIEQKKKEVDEAKIEIRRLRSKEVPGASMVKETPMSKPKRGRARLATTGSKRKHPVTPPQPSQHIVENILWIPRSELSILEQR
ncbi:unnamed protein product [Darwinula stevensoni]|uniref:Uncharacterized protein n=1 Tax=Darwinula stevensoni TaxID=69355 RepID=A0A7R8X7Y5_9CRUS|nr:unnamed protein product [Darwinula stevensoni]CAG0882804.1 unnamed protein product [Darwinula stevensoni]